MKHFIIPLREAGLSSEEVDAVFLNLEEIVKHQLPFLTLLEQRVSEWNEHPLIGDLFLEHVCLYKGQVI